MKKIATILLLALLLFNFVGYKLLFYALEERANDNIVSVINTDRYNDAELVTLTVPLSMPYISDSKDFEKKDGEITVNGKVYHYVKQKISQGNLVLMCLPDEAKTNLKSAKDEFFKLANELNNNAASKKSGESSQLAKLVISDYEQLQTTSIKPYLQGQLTKSFLHKNSSFALLKGEGLTPEQPPEA